MSSTPSNHFSFNLGLNKAFEKNGDFYLETEVSDTRLDYHDQHMTEKALDSMVSMLKNGFVEPDGKLQKVYLLDNHSATFEMGYADDGKITKSADGHFNLSATWKLIKDNPQAMQLYKEVASGDCKKQLSVGGDAMGHAYFNETLGKTVGSLDDVLRLEHVACTRPGKAAVSSTGFIGAMLKSIEGLTIIKGTEEIMEQKQFDDFKLATEKSQADQAASIDALTTLVKSLIPPPAKSAEEIAVEKAASDAAIANAPMTMAGLTAILEKNNAALVASLMAPGARTQTTVPAGAMAVSKSTDDVVAEALRLAAGNQTAASETLSKKKEQLALLSAEREMVIEKRRSMAKFTGAEDFAAQVLEKKYSLLRTEIHLEEATGIAV